MSHRLGKDAAEARRWVAEKMIPEFPLNVFRDNKLEALLDSALAQRPAAEVLEIPVKPAEVSRAAEKYGHSFQQMGIKVAGFGGQGALLLGQLLTEMGMREGLGSGGLTGVWAEENSQKCNLEFELPGGRRQITTSHEAQPNRWVSLPVVGEVGGMALSVLGMFAAAFGYLPPIGGAIAQEIIDLTAVLNALRVALSSHSLTDF